MIPEEIAEDILPALAQPDEDVPKVDLPCGGVYLKFTLPADDSEEDLTWDELNSWDATLEEVAEAAGNNAFSYSLWQQTEKGVYENKDNCWPSLVLAPETYLEHNEVSGRHVIYIVDEDSAILTGDRCKEGLKRIRSAVEDGLAEAPMVINPDWRTWSRFDLDAQPRTNSASKANP